VVAATSAGNYLHPHKFSGHPTKIRRSSTASATVLLSVEMYLISSKSLLIYRIANRFKIQVVIYYRKAPKRKVGIVLYLPFCCKIVHCTMEKEKNSLTPMS